MSCFRAALDGVCAGVTGKCTNTAGIADTLVAEILQRAEVEVIADKTASVSLHPRRNSRVVNCAYYRPDGRRRFQPLWRGAGNPEFPSQDAVIVRRGGVIKILREPLDADNGAARSLTGHKKRIRAKGLDRVDEFPHRGVVGAGQQAWRRLVVAVAPAARALAQLPMRR